MESRRWLNQGQPQTMVIACFLLYINAAFGTLNVLQSGSVIALSGLGLLYYAIVIVGGIMGGYGVANERKWGYLLALATAFAPFALRTYLLHNPFSADLVSLIFEIALVALLLHPQSREYHKIYFK